MSSLSALQVRQLAAQSTATRVTDDSGILLRIKHNGTAAVTSVTVITATNIILIDADGTTTSTFATDATLGAVADTINASASWTCKILDGLRATASADALGNGVITADVVNEESGYSATVVNASIDDYLVRCTYDRTAGNVKPQGGHRVKLSKIEYNLNVSAAEAGAVRIYEWNPVDRTESLIWAAASVDVTATTHDFANSPITAKDGNDLIVLITDGTSITDSAANYLQVSYTRE